MFWMAFMLLNKHFLWSGSHLCFRINIFYIPARAARTAGTARTTPTLQNDRKFEFEKKQKRCNRILFWVGVNFSRIRGGGAGRQGGQVFYVQEQFSL